MSELLLRLIPTYRQARGLFITKSKQTRALALIALLALVGILPLSVEWQMTLTIGIAWAIATTGLDVWQGYGGLLSFGHGVFIGLGAYTWALLRANHELHWSLALVLAVGAGALVAVILGVVVVRINHFGVAIVTFFTAFILAAVLNSSSVRDLTGTQGGMAVPPLLVLGQDLSGGRALYYTALLALAIVMVLAVNYTRSSSGRALELVREEPLVAGVLGVRVARARLLAFVFSGCVAALSGVVLAQGIAYVTPDSFSPWQSVILVAMVVVGGQRTVIGPVLGALAYSSLATVFQDRPDEQAIVSAVIFLIFVVLVPGGLASLNKGRRSQSGAGSPNAVVEAPDGSESVLEDLDPAAKKGAPGRPSEHREPGTEPALVVRGAAVKFNGVKALTGADLATRDGEIHALIGPNGAGKTTLINAITGIQPLSGGEIELFGRSITGLRPVQVRDAGVSRTFQNPALVGTLTIMENVLVGTYSTERRSFAVELLLGTTSPGQDRTLIERSGDALRLVGVPESLWGELAGNVSFGMQKLVDIARALVGAPRVLLLDEPTAGIGADEIGLVERAIQRVRRDHGTTVVFVAHHVPFVRRLADRVTVLDAGAVLETGRPEVVTSSPRVLVAFIGEPEESKPADRARPDPDPEVGQSPAGPTQGLHVRGLQAGYAKAPVIIDVNLDVRPGEIVALTGVNGAGKSTTLRALSAVIPSSASACTMAGVPLGNEPHLVARQGLIHVPEGRGIIAALTVEENLRLGALAVGRSERDLSETFDLFPKLADLRKAPAGVLSGGEQQMLAIARGLLAEPKVLMIDELSLGLSPRAAQEALHAVVEIGRRGPGILLVDQNVAALSAVCDRVYILRDGRTSTLPDQHSLATIGEHYF